MKHLSKIIGLSALAIAGLAITLVTVRGTQANTNNAPGSMWGMMGLHRGGPGVSGNVTAINGNSITLNSNGTTYTVDASNAQNVEKVTGTSGSMSKTAIKVSDIQVGDTLRVTGTVSGTTVTANRIIDGNLPAKQNPAATGTVSSINGNTITLNSNGTTYTVDAGNARIMIAKPAGTALQNSGIQTGDTVTVFGTVNGSSIAAAEVVDGSGFGPHMGMGMMGVK
ncbi:MAG: DUF5666 domain-containing protein [Candidatus Saccharibacteria bacterium]